MVMKVFVFIRGSESRTITSPSDITCFQEPTWRALVSYSLFSEISHFVQVCNNWLEENF